MIKIFQFMVLYGRYYYKYYCFYIFTIHFLLSFTQSYPLLIVLLIDYCCFSFVYLSVVAVGVFIFVCGCCWCFCACLRSALISLFPYFIVAVDAFVLLFRCSCLTPGYSWYHITVLWLLSLVCLLVCGCYKCFCCFCGCCWYFCGCVWSTLVLFPVFFS